MAVMTTLVVLSACDRIRSVSSDDDRVVARVFDRYLHSSDLEHIVTPGTSRNDSMAIIRQYVENWIQRESVLKKAEDNLTDDQKFVERQLEEYRNSLITYIYESELVKQKLDTSISEKEIELYYNDHPNHFQLKSNIIQAYYFRLPNNSPKSAKIKSWFRSNKPKDRQLLEEYCYQFATEYSFNAEEWILFDDLLMKVPIQTYNQEQFLRNNRFIEIPDSNGTYYVEIKGFKMRESASPLQFERENIRNLILNKRKIDLIRSMEKDAYQDALQKNEIENFLTGK
ncbi:MAG: hypothetical protein RLZZ630_536 [Bacteroidota bacterium]|jgi:hypothetical protein